MRGVRGGRGREASFDGICAVVDNKGTRRRRRTRGFSTPMSHHVDVEEQSVREQGKEVLTYTVYL
jgi:hypothetical protein